MLGIERKIAAVTPLLQLIIDAVNAGELDAAIDEVATLSGRRGR